MRKTIIYIIILLIFRTQCIAEEAPAIEWIDRSGQLDEGILLVNEYHLLSADYVPEGLVNLYNQRHSFRLKNSEIYLTRQTYEAMQNMFTAAAKVGMKDYIITNGYHNYQYQQQMYIESDSVSVQRPGASEHQTGLAFDVTIESDNSFENKPQYIWLTSHAHEYGFIQRYPVDKNIFTGVRDEPGHFRYVGVQAAK